ncbi:MAG: NAD(P)/FAD-dependent oxidoreductase [Hyphomicrobiaceae bacterium]
MNASSASGLRIAVVGSGISGLSAAWLLGKRHDVTLFEQSGRLGGHANTVSVDGPHGPVEVDTGFVVFNHDTYPNLVALLDHLGVATSETSMSFAVSRHSGNLEYAGTDLASLFAQRANILRLSFWSMLRDLRRFYATATRDLPALDSSREALGDYLQRRGYGAKFRDDHLLPMAAAIWSAPADTMLDYPAASFIRFFGNHGLLKLHARPAWHTVVGGSKEYVRELIRPFTGQIRASTKVVHVTRNIRGALLQTADGTTTAFDHVVIAGHADDALAMLGDASNRERHLLGAFRYTRNQAVLHTDAALMPRRREVWSSWNYVEHNRACVTYWMNRLQRLPGEMPLFVTINPDPYPSADSILHVENYSHPVFDARAMEAQRDLWSLQGQLNSWYCGAYFGAGFHEDGLQAGLAVAEDLGGLRRPWCVADESARISRGRFEAIDDVKAAS